jgi:dTDP-4-dehydrorhamnose reductase
MRVLLFGSSGQLGSAFRDLARTEAWPLGWELVALTSKDCDLSSSESIRSALHSYHPDVILNAAAYTAVDLAEKEQEKCEAINVHAPEVLARYCALQGIPLVHYSSDYVYDGAGAVERLEDAPHSPVNFYGASKAKGDEAIIRSGCEHLIFRSSWVFSHTGKNFVKTMLRLGAERPELKVVEDQIGAPTYAPDLAAYSLQALMRALELKVEGGGFPSGVYHLTNSDHTSWADFARAILPGVKVIGIPSSEYPTPAKRPMNSRLSLEKFKTTFWIAPRPWREALKACLDQLKEHHG